MQSGKSSRRGFLTAAACVPALAAAFLLSRRTAVPAPVAAPSGQASAASGYRETEHIRKYYRAAAYF